MIKMTFPLTLLTLSCYRHVATVVLAVFMLFGVSIKAQVPQAPPEKQAPPEIVPLKPSYSLPDDARDPFYVKEKVVPPKQVKTGPTGKDLVDQLNISGLMGKPENPAKAGVLIGTKIYRIGNFIPVNYENTVYSLVLVSVEFPAQIVLKYKEEMVPLTINKKTTKGN